MIKKSCVRRLRCDSELQKKLKNAGVKSSNEHCRFMNANLIISAKIKRNEPVVVEKVSLG